MEGEILSPAQVLAPLFGWSPLATSAWLVMMILGVVLFIVDVIDQSNEDDDEWEWCDRSDCPRERE